MDTAIVLVTIFLSGGVGLAIGAILGFGISLKRVNA